METNNPFEFWQKFWKTADPFNIFQIPLSEEEIDKKIQGLKHVEVWLDFNLQAVRTQLTWLEQQKQMLKTTTQFSQTMSQPTSDSD